MTQYTFMVFSEPADGREAEYNEWYDNQHLGDVLQTPGFVAAQRFRLQPAPDAPAGAPSKYVALYEIETDDLAAAMAALSGRAGTPSMPISTALSGVQAHMAEAVGPRVVASHA